MILSRRDLKNVMGCHTNNLKFRIQNSKFLYALQILDARGIIAGARRKK